jgi:hypothetical protein
MELFFFFNIYIKKKKNIKAKPYFKKKMKRKSCNSDQQLIKRQRRLECVIKKRKERRLKWLMRKNILISNVREEFRKDVFGDYLDFETSDRQIKYSIDRVSHMYFSNRMMQNSLPRCFWKKSVLYGISYRPTDCIHQICERSNKIVHVFEIIYPHLIEYLDHNSLKQVIKTYGKKNSYNFIKAFKKCTNSKKIACKISKSLKCDVGIWIKLSDNFKKLYYETLKNFHKYDENIKEMAWIVNVNHEERAKILTEAMLKHGYILRDEEITMTMVQACPYFSMDKLIAYVMVAVECTRRGHANRRNKYLTELNNYVSTFDMNWKQASEYIISLM